MAPVPVPLPLEYGPGAGGEVPVVDEGGVGSADETDTGVNFVITNYKCTLLCPVQPIFSFRFLGSF